MTRSEKIELYASELLAALDRMHGTLSLSENVQQWRRELRSVIPKDRSESDRADAA